MIKKNTNFYRFIEYYKPHKKLFSFDICCAFIVALCSLIYPLIAKNIINDYVPNKQLNLLITWCCVLFAIYIFKALLTYLIQYKGHILGVRIQSDMRRDMFTHLQRLPYSYFDANKTGSIMSRIVNDLYDISELAHHGPENIFLSSVTIIGSLIMLATINIWMSLIVLLIMPFIIIFASITKSKMKDSFKQMREEVSKVNAEVEVTISGIRVTKAYNCEEYTNKRFANVNRSFVKARSSAYKSMGTFFSGMGFISDMLYLIVLASGGIMYYYAMIDIGELTACILYIAMLLAPIKSLVAIYEQIQSGSTGFRRFCEIIDEKPELDDENAIVLEKIVGNITFENVSFSYDSDESLILNDISFSLTKGKTTALIGLSGSGKTTICHLLMRFYDIDTGAIMLDGQDIRKFTMKSLRDNIGIVAQDVFIFDGTIRENIFFGKLDASEEEIIDAAKKSCIHEYISKLPNGYDTWVGERGIKLSGGQRQRISIARAFLKNPPVLILDEATSALDTFTEHEIQQSLNILSADRTVLVVAHRQSTIESADVVIELKDGKIA